MGIADPSIATYLEVLGVSEYSSMSEVKQAHRDLASVWHPDRFLDNPRLQDKATEKLKEINVAYEALVKFHEAHGSFSFVPGDLEPPREYIREEPGGSETDMEERPSEAAAEEEEISGRSWFARHVVLLSVLISICLVGLVYIVLAHKKLDLRSPPTSPTPYQATVVESGPQAAVKPPPPAKIPSEKGKTTPPGKPAGGSKYFTLGSSKEQVRAVEGAPQQLTDSRWAYGSSYVDFTKGQVTGWLSSSLNPLSVKITPSRETTGDSFTQGSSQDQVAAVQGTPTQISKNRWSYGFSYVDFEKGRVKSWYSSSLEPLSVVMTPSREPENDYFTVGSSKDEVLGVQGTPTQLTENRWAYGYSYIDFEKGRVTRWYNSERDPLKVNSE